MARSTQKTSTDRPNVTAAAPASASKRNRNGLPWKRYFTRPGTAPFDEVQWESREAVITNEKGEIVFEQHDVEIPTSWSQVATNVVVSKYFRGVIGTPERERSVKQLIGRVVRTIHGWGNKQGYFATPEASEIFRDELTHLLVHQKAAFNSPVWFNAGIEPRPQLSACQPYDALVSTPKGMIAIGQLVESRAIGQTVYDADGTTRIQAVKANGQKPVRRVVLRNGSFIQATPDHVVRAVREPYRSRVACCPGLAAGYAFASASTSGSSHSRGRSPPCGGLLCHQWLGRLCRRHGAGERGQRCRFGSRPRGLAASRRLCRRISKLDQSVS